MKKRAGVTIKSEHPSKAKGKRFIDKVYMRCYDTEKKELVEPIFFASEDMIFMLSTGLKDADNRFVYHLDVVEDKKGKRWLVEWGEGRFFLSYLTNEATRSISEVKNYKIVGNYFKSPELLISH